MRIAIVLSYPIGHETGTANVSEHLAKELAKDNEVLYVCLAEKYGYLKNKNGLSYLKIPAVVINGIWIPQTTPKIKDQIFDSLTDFSPDVIHAQNIVFNCLVALIWAAQNSVPYIVTFHSLPSEGISYVFPRLKKDKIVSAVNYRLTKNYLKRFLSKVDLVIALNKSVLKSIKEIGDFQNVKIIKNGLALKNFYALAAHKPTGKHINFTYLGTYLARKNQEYLIKAFRYLPNHHKLNLYGSLESGKPYIRKLTRLIDKHNVQNVSINGFLDQRGVYKALGKSHYFVSASVKEVQSLVIVEALAAGKPVIALTNETTNEVLDGKNSLVLSQKTSPKAFAQKLKTYVATTNNNYDQTSSYCRASVSEFDLSVVAQRILATYKQVAASNYKKRAKSKSEWESLVPQEVRKLFDKELVRTINQKRPSYLKFILATTFAFSLLVTTAGFVIKLFKKSKD